MARPAGLEIQGCTITILPLTVSDSDPATASRLFSRERASHAELGSREIALLLKPPKRSLRQRVEDVWKAKREEA
jgi:hypothetical protein